MVKRGCPLCLGKLADGENHHEGCARRVFGLPSVPTLREGSEELTEAIVTQGQKLSGAQPKLLVSLDPEEAILQPTPDGRYLLKPQSPKYRNVPENEHLTMCLARCCGLRTAEAVLVALDDGQLAYVTRRFDRTEGDPPGKRAQFDFCQLLGLQPEQKYQRTAEECVEVIRQFSSDVEEDLRRLFRLLVFGYWVGNGDLHLKNLSLLEEDAGVRLAPAYDLVCTWIYDDRRLALYVNGCDRDVKWPDWLALARAGGLGEGEAEAIADDVLAREEDALAMIDRSWLPSSLRASYRQCLRKRGRALRSGR